MLLSKETKVGLTYHNIKKYLDLGYKFDYFINSKGNKSVKRGSFIYVKVEDLDFMSNALIKYECDYCGKEIEVRFCDYMRWKSNIGERDACKECGSIKQGDICFEKHGTRSPFGLKEVQDKIKDIIREKYGVDNVNELAEVKQKIRETNLRKYGALSYTQTEEGKEKSRQTCLDKYGYDNASKSPIIINKIKETMISRYGDYYACTDESKERYKQYCLDNYGVVNMFQREEIKEKTKQTMIERYGVDSLMKIPEIAEKRTKAMMKTKSKMGILPSSRQQEYLHTLYGGTKNYVVSSCALDIAIIEDMIDIEFDGSGHNLRVIHGDCTQEEFNRKELSRKYYLKSKGWNDFRIISLKDRLPSDEILLKMLNISKDWIGQGHSWIKFDIDNSTYETSKGINSFDYGALRKITDKDLI